MSTTTREFTRRFADYRKAARDGKVISVRERDGTEYTFTLKRPAPASLAEAVAHLAGVAETGMARKSFSGYGRR